MLCAGFMAVSLFTGCTFPHSGPSYGSITEIAEQAESYPVSLIPFDHRIKDILIKQENSRTFKEAFGNVKPDHYRINGGDVIDIYIWESAPALLFGTKEYSAEDLSVSSEKLPSQTVEEDGYIAVPFAGRINARGRTVSELQKDILNLLNGKANNPQVLVQITNRPFSQAIVIGDVNNSKSIPLTPKGERILDAVAAGSGVNQSFNKVMLSLSRNGKTVDMPLESVIKDPSQNIYLYANDVLVAMYQPWTYTVLGPSGKNQEVKLEATGLNLIQALARAGGLNDNISDPRGVFIFRYEDREIFEALLRSINNQEKGTEITASYAKLSGEFGNLKKIPVVYQVDFANPRTIFDAQNFNVKNGDVMYLASSSGYEITKFLRMIGLMINPVVSWGNTVNNLSN